MAKNLITTNELTGTRVIGGKRGTKRIGKIRYFVFHPTEKKIIGFIVKRPDFLWMFKRSNLFVAIDGYDMLDGRMMIRLDPEATDGKAYKHLGVDPDKCIMWVGLPLMTEDGSSYGVVSNVIFNRLTGKIQTIEADNGATSKALLGKRDIPADLIRGFRKGAGVALSDPAAGAYENENPELGCILVSDEVKVMETEGGLAEKAGQATAVVADKASKATAKVSDKASKAAKKTGEVVNKGAYATGKQISKTKGMFSAFKDEYKKARNDDE